MIHCPEGAYCLDEKGEYFSSPSLPMPKSDIKGTVGAGDALFASFLHFYAKGLHPVDCLKRAQVFAAAKIRESGASKGFVTEGEVEEMLTWK